MVLFQEIEINDDFSSPSEGSDGTPDCNNHEGVSNPYSVTISEQSSVNIVSDDLVGSDNYFSWKESMETALIIRNKYCFVTGTLPKPVEDDPMIHNWERCDTLVFFWILNSVSNEIAESLKHLNSAKEVWDYLYNQFHQADAFRLLELQDKLQSLKQGSMTLDDYFLELTTLLLEITDKFSINCDCCKCGETKIWKECRDQMYTLQFLCGLNEKYSSIRSQIFLINPLPDISKAFDIVEKFERENTLISDTEEAMIFNTSVSRSANGVPFSSKDPSLTANGTVSNQVDETSMEELPSMEEDTPHVPILADSSLGKWFYIDCYGIERGPAKLADLKALMEQGSLFPDHMIKHLDTNRWVTLENAISPLVQNVSDTVTQLVNLPEDSTVDVTQTETVEKEASDTNASDLEFQEDFQVDKRVADLLKDYTMVPGRELEALGEALQIKFLP